MPAVPIETISLRWALCFRGLRDTRKQPKATRERPPSPQGECKTASMGAAIGLATGRMVTEIVETDLYVSRSYF